MKNQMAKVEVDDKEKKVTLHIKDEFSFGESKQKTK